MRYRQLGNTGLSVSEIGFGGWPIGGPVDIGFPVGWDGVDDDTSAAAVRRARDLGVNFFDTSDMYGEGRSEELLGRLLASTDCLIATKGGIVPRGPDGPTKDFSTDHLLRACEASLRRLRRETIDVYQLHNPPPEVWEQDEVYALLDRMKADGKIRTRGQSISTPEEGIHLIENRKVDVLQVLFNILNQEPSRTLLPLAEKKGIGIITRVPLASGLLTGKFTPSDRFSPEDNRANYLSPKRMKEVVQKVERLKEIIRDSGLTLQQVALAFILSHHGVSTAIPGAKTPKQAEQNAAASGIELKEDLVAAIKKEFSDYNFYLRYGIRV